MPSHTNGEVIRMAKHDMKRPEEKTHKKSDIVPEIQGTENRSNNSYSNNSNNNNYSNNSNNNSYSNNSNNNNYSNNSNNNSYSNNNQSNSQC